METKERTEGRLRRLLEQPGTFLKWVLFAGVIGLAAGGVSSAFYYALNAVTALREANPWLLWLLPLGGVAIVLLYRICGMEKDRGTNFVLVAVRENQPLRLRTAPLIFAATVLTHLLGGSSGREGAILQIGGSLSSKIGRWMRLDDKDSRIITMCGMSAAFSALFGTPLTAAMFAMEVTSVGVLYYAAIVPCVLSAIIGLWVAQLCGVPPTAFSLQGVPNLTPVTLLQCIGMGVLFALLSILFCRMMHAAPRLYDKYLPNPVARAAAGGALVIALTFLVWLWNPGTYDYNGAGTAVIHAAIGGEARPEAFLLKMLFTTITLGAGFKGGEIRPGVLYRGHLRLHRRPPAGAALLLWSGAGHGVRLLRRHQLPHDLPAALPGAVRREQPGHVHRPEPGAVRRVYRRGLHALRLLRPLQRAEDRLQQAPAGVHRQEGQ